jgi:hypothetical protein
MTQTTTTTSAVHEPLTAAHTTAASATSRAAKLGTARASAPALATCGALAALSFLVGLSAIWSLREDRAGGAGAGPRQRMRRASPRQLRTCHGDR